MSVASQMISDGALEEMGLDDDEKLQEVGMKFRETYLAIGGGSYPAKMFCTFTGRDPSADILLKSLKLADVTSN